MRIGIEIGPGELADRLSILRLRAERLPDGPVRAEARHARDRLETLARAALPEAGPVAVLVRELAGLNAELWDLETDVRAHLARDARGVDFAETAARIFALNEKRADLKGEIDHQIAGRTAEGKFFGGDRAGM